MTFCAYDIKINVRTKSEVNTLSPRTGRPKVTDPMNDRLYIRISDEEKKEITEFAKENGYTLLELIRIGIQKVKEIKEKK